MAMRYAVLALGLAASSTAQQPGFGGRPGASAPTTGPWSGSGKSAGSPAYNYIFENPLPIPPIAQPEFSETIDGRTIDYYQLTIESFQKQIYPNLGKANLVGYNGSSPGPTFLVQRGHETIIRCLNNGDEPASLHLHGSYTHAPWDGWAEDTMQPGSYKDYYYPNTENARSIWYHDHAENHTASDAYYGQAGVYTIYDPAEDALGLPSGKYDVPLSLTDKLYQSNGDLASPEGDTLNFFGDTIEVNGQPWPYLNVEPRKYRLRLYDMSLSRAYDLYLQDKNSKQVPFQVIASDSGLFGAPVSSSDVTISMGERYEIVVDFAAYKGQNVTLKNGMQQQQIPEYSNTDKVMQFVVGETVSDSSNNGAVPATLNAAIQWPPKRDVVDHVFNFQMGGDAEWTINGISFDDTKNRVLARPPQGTVELWELHHTGGPAVHPVHIHLVNLQVISRVGGSRGLLPYEAAGLKDVVMLEPGEVVQVLAYYGPWDGVYMFHCHNLIHEDRTMMDAFNVTFLESLGYEFNSTLGYTNPLDTRFAPKPSAASAFAPAAISSAVASLASLSAYANAASVIAAQSAYYATAGYHGDGTNAAGPTTTVAPVSSGYGFATQTVAQATTALVTAGSHYTARPGGHPFRA